jgi:hypothetical protein
MEEQLQTSEKQTETKVDVKDEMRQFAESLEKGEEQGDVDPETDPKPVDEDESLDDEVEDKDKEPEDKEKDDEKKRPNRYQKQKAKIEAQAALISKVTSEKDEAIKIANAYRNRLLKIVAKYEADMKAVQAGKVPSDADHELWALRSKQEEAKELEAIDKKLQEDRIKAEIDQNRSEMSQDYQAEAMSLAKSYGLAGEEGKAFARKVLLYTATEWESGNTKLTLKDAAKEFGLLMKKRRQTPEQEQFDANSKAPSTIRRGGNRPPSYEITGKDEDSQKKIMKNYIDSLKGK